MTVLSQRDNRWRNKKLGFSNLTIGNYGCLITALTQLLNNTFGYKLGVDEVNEKLKAVKAFQGALLLWSRVHVAFPELKFRKRGYNYNNADVWIHINVKKTPVMVEVNGAKIGASKHWVLFLGNQRMVDPWFGDIRSTNYYPLTGYALFERK